MSKMTKRWLSLMTTVAVAFVMCFGCMGMFADKVFAEGEATPDLTVVNGTKTAEFFLEAATEQTPAQLYYIQSTKKGDKKVYLKNVNGKTYSAVNNSGNGGADQLVATAAGPLVKDVLAVAGLTTKKAKNKALRFETAAGESDSVTIMGSQLFGTRYYFPKQLRADDGGVAVVKEEAKGKKKVSAILDLTNSKGITPVFGQASPSDRNNPSFYNGIAKIVVLDATQCEPVAKLQAVEVDTAGKIVSSQDITGNVESGTLIGFDFTCNNKSKKANISHVYYSVGKANPTMDSDIYNWYYKKKDGTMYYHPIVTTKAGEMTIKAKVFCYGQKDSAVQTFKVIVGKNIKDCDITYDVETGKVVVDGVDESNYTVKYKFNKKKQTVKATIKAIPDKGVVFGSVTKTLSTKVQP